MNYLGQIGGLGEETTMVIVAFLFIFGTPIIAMLLHHQRKMAETLRGDQSQNEQIAQLQSQINQLAHLVHQQTISIDDLKASSPVVAPQSAPQVAERFASLNEP